MSLHFSHASWPRRELHRRPQWLRPHGGAAPMLAHPHVSLPKGGLPIAPVVASAWRRRAHFGTPLTRFVAHRGLHRRSQWLRPHGGAAPISAQLSHASWPLGSSTEGRSGCIHMAAPRPFRHPLHTFRGPTWRSTKGRSSIFGSILRVARGIRGWVLRWVNLLMIRVV